MCMNFASGNMSNSTLIRKLCVRAFEDHCPAMPEVHLLNKSEAAVRFHASSSRGCQLLQIPSTAHARGGRFGNARVRYGDGCPCMHPHELVFLRVRASSSPCCPWPGASKP